LIGLSRLRSNYSSSNKLQGPFSTKQRRTGKFQGTGQSRSDHKLQWARSLRVLRRYMKRTCRGGRTSCNMFRYLYLLCKSGGVRTTRSLCQQLRL
jgi:ribosomal protein L19E